jgi:signal transduction histidine kinase
VFVNHELDRQTTTRGFVTLLHDLVDVDDLDGATKAFSTERQLDRTAAAEAERKRWARELHDETLQGIAAVRVLLASSRRVDETELRTIMARAEVELQCEVDRLRDIIHDVRPSSLDDLGLMAAMEALVARHAQDGPALQLDVDLDHEAGRAPERLLPEVGLAIYRIAQEALTNALKHADATMIQIVVSEIEGEVGVRVRDDGCGYDRASSVAGFGLEGMQQRAELLQGRLHVESRPGQGTSLEAHVPARHCAPAPADG